MKKIIEYFDKIISNPRCELNYNKDYELLIAIVLSAQTTDKRVNKVTKVLFERYKSLEELSKADINDIETIIREIGTYKKKARFVKNIAYVLVTDKIEKIPNDRNYLEKLSGVGRKTINVFLSEIYNEGYIGVDTHVNRISKRLNLVDENDDLVKIENKLMKKIPKDKRNRVHHQMVLFGRYHCMARNPKCSDCELKSICKYKKSTR